MEKLHWLNKVRENSKVLTKLIQNYHPQKLAPNPDKKKIDASITAPEAERACEFIRSQIRKDEIWQDPDAIFNSALSNNDVETISGLLSQTWFGVPESTGCWQIPGFSILVDLLDDPVEYDGPEE